ncbi:MAG: aspartate aminotransferase family protein, partial [Thermoguttaceae bacterium]
MHARADIHDLWRQFVNPDYVDLLESLDYGRQFTWAQGTKLRDEEGRLYTDFLAGFGVHNAGHNHPRLIRRLSEELAACGPSMLNIDAPLPAALLAQRLSGMTDPALCRAVFTSSGTEAVEAAIKITRAATGRNLLVSCHGGWHGLSTGALALMGDTDHRRGLGPLLADAMQIPFGDVAALEEACTRNHPAAFFVEPIQGEGGIRVPMTSYLHDSAEICHKAGCLLVIDEIQTGLGRTGAEFATSFAEVVPDVLLVGKALSGGLVPVAACMTTARTWSRALAGPTRCNLCASTFGGGRLAMTAGLEMLGILREEHLADRAQELGSLLLDGLRSLAGRHPMIREVRGQGLLGGIEFEPPSGLLTTVVPRWAREQLFAQVVAAVLLRDHALVTQTCGLAPNVLRIEPPLAITREEIEVLLQALDQVLTAYPSFRSATWSALRKTA